MSIAASLSRAALLGLLAVAGTVSAAPPDYPETPVRDVADTLHGRPIVDPYRWLEEDGSAEVRSWTDAQNAFTRRALDVFPGRKPLEERLQALYALPVMSRPRLHGGRLFYSKRTGTQNQPVVMVRSADGTAPPRVLIDPNTLSADGTVALDWMYPSRDGALVAHGTSPSGSEKSTLHVRRVESGEDLAETIPHTQFTSVAWDRDGNGFHYARHPAPGEVPAGEEVFHEKIFHHVLGQDPARDPLVWSGEGRALQERRAVTASTDGEWLFLSASLDWSKNDLWLRPASGSEEWTPVAIGLDGRTRADAWKGKLYLLTNVGASRYRIAVVDPAAPGSEKWKTLITEQQGVIEDFVIAGGRLVLNVTEKAVSRVLVFTLGGKLEREAKLPAMGAVASLSGEPTQSAVYLIFQSFAYPSTVLRYDLATGEVAPLESTPAALDPGTIDVRQEWVTSNDGTDVPVFVVQRKGGESDGNRPTILSGYGGFNVSQTPAFKPHVVPWLEAGGVYVQACLRGGGEFGREWHEAGRLENKQNVFDDFHAVAGWLVNSGITKPARLAAQGGSNGGLLVGAALTQRPELFGAIVCQVPLLDMIRYQRFSIARYWVPEYGTSEDPKQMPFLLAYSPYHNVKAGFRYPATLLTTAESDSRVAPLHARKMAALLQARSAGDAPILLRVETKAGHGAGKPTTKRVLEGVDILSFIMIHLGVSFGS